jgi:CheY-like chemotaxis protein/signal transduction histidine kinase/HPt (histidine-containing phosphotransfer) domain-containing protein
MTQPTADVAITRLLLGVAAVLEILATAGMIAPPVLHLGAVAVAALAVAPWLAARSAHRQTSLPEERRGPGNPAEAPALAAAPDTPGRGADAPVGPTSHAQAQGLAPAEAEAPAVALAQVLELLLKAGDEMFLYRELPSLVQQVARLPVVLFQEVSDGSAFLRGAHGAPPGEELSVPSRVLAAIQHPHVVDDAAVLAEWPHLPRDITRAVVVPFAQAGATRGVLVAGARHDHTEDLTARLNDISRVGQNLTRYFVRRQADNELQRYYDEVEALLIRSEEQGATLARQARELEEARNEALQASRAKGEFLATMSHEIRTPMNGVLGMIEALAATDLDDNQRSKVDTLRESGEMLLRLHQRHSRQLQDRGGADRAGGNPVLDRARWRKSVCESMRPRPRRAASRSRSRTDGAGDVARMLGDPLRVRQIVHQSRQQRRQVHRQHRLFGSFSQVDASTTRKFGGTGLGLAICKRLAMAMGGDVDVTSSEGRGSVFSVRLTFAPSEHAQSLKEPTTRKVLAVIESATAEDALRQHADVLGHELVSVRSAKEARALLQAGETFDVLLQHLQEGGEDAELEMAADERGIPKIIAVPTNDRIRSDRDRYAAVIAIPVRFDAFRRAVQPPEARVAPVVQKGKRLVDAPHRLLIAEDNHVNQRVAVRYLARLGFKDIEVVENGRLAAERCQEEVFDLIFMDCHMPEMDGYEATAAIRAEGQNTETSIVAMTARAMEGDRQRCLDAGMDDYVSKPVKLEALREVLGANLPSTPHRATKAGTPPAASPGPGGDAEPSSPDHASVDAMMEEVVGMRVTERDAQGAPQEAAHAEAAPAPAPEALQAPGADVLAGPAPADSHAEPASLEEAAAPVDLARIEDTTEGDAAFARELVELYLGDVASRLDAIETALTTGDAPRVQREAHTVKGASANVGATGLAELAYTLEQIGRAGDLDDAPDVRGELAEEYGRVRAFFEDYLASLPA